MTHASLFSGIGGFDIAAEWAGWDNVFNCEIADFPRKVLNYHFPNAIQYDDIKSTDFTVWRGRVDVLTGGFPCQPFSTAGKRKGTEDNRYLWSEMLRAIREIRPRWVVGENVLGIVNWNRGMVFEQVHVDLEAEGYEVQAFVLPACGIGAPHRRDRTWFVAHGADAGVESMQGRKNGIRSDRNASNSADNGCRTRDGEGRENRERDVFSGEQEGSEIWGEHNRCDRERTAIYPNSERLSELHSSAKFIKSTFGDNKRSNGEMFNWSDFPTQSPVHSRDDGFPIPMDGITFPKWRTEAIKAYGNAIVPQVAYRIFDTINKYERL